MDDSFSNEGEKTVTDLFEHIDGICLRTLVVAFDIFGEVSVAQLLNNIVIFGTLHDIVKGDDVI